MFVRLPITLINFIVMDSSTSAESVVNQDMENRSKIDSYRFKLSPDIENDQKIIAKILPGISKVTQYTGSKNIDIWCSMACIDTVNQNAAVMIFINEDKSAQVRLQFDSNVMDKTKGGEIMNAIVEVLKA